MAVNGQLVKKEIDCADDVAKFIPEFEQKCAAGQLQSALDALCIVEKKCRMGGDAISAAKLLTIFVKTVAKLDLDQTVQYMLIFSKRRSQLTQALATMIQEAYALIDDFPAKEDQLKLIEGIRKVGEGKIYVEVERARATLRLAKIREAEGDYAGAATALLELQVETYGSMEKREKVEMLLEQMRLCLAKDDYIRAQIISRKINMKYFEHETTKDLKRKYYELMIQFDEHEGNYMNVCRHYQALFLEDKELNNIDVSFEKLSYAIVFVLLAPYDSEQSDMIHRLNSEKLLEKLPFYKALLTTFIKEEVVPWTEVETRVKQELTNAQSPMSVVYGKNAKRLQDLRKRVIEHNIRIIAKYYSDITMERLCTILDLNITEVEDTIGTLVTLKTIFARMDRNSGLVTFRAKFQPVNTLDSWKSKIDKLTDKVAETTHMINKEEMVYHHLLQSSRSTTSAVRAGGSGDVAMN